MRPSFAERRALAQMIASAPPFAAQRDPQQALQQHFCPLPALLFLLFPTLPLQVIYDKSTGRSKGFGFISLKSSGDAAAAIVSGHRPLCCDNCEQTSCLTGASPAPFSPHLLQSYPSALQAAWNGKTVGGRVVKVNCE